MSLTSPVATPSTFDWSQGDAFLHTLFNLLQSTADASLEGLESNLFVLHAPGKSFVVLRYVEALAPKLVELVSDLVTQRGQTALEVALLGGSERARELLERTPPRRGSLLMLHMAEPSPGRFTEPQRVLGRGRSELLVALECARRQAGSAIDSERALAAIEQARARFARELGEQRAFSKQLSLHKPRATLAILGLILGMFLLQMTTDSAVDTKSLIQRGALSKPEVFAGEWWRLASCTVLHGGLMHVAFNGYVLFALGGLLERLLGSARFIVLYVVTGLAASLGSLFLIGGVSVGASGAIWGLLGAEAALAFGKHGLLPASVKKSLQRAAVVNLAINTAASFLPHVDWAAHFVGGAVGAALLATGLLLPARQKTAQHAGLGVLAATLATLFFGAALYGVLLSATGIREI